MQIIWIVSFVIVLNLCWNIKSEILFDFVFVDN